MSTTSFAERLKLLREAAHLTQPELAARASMNRFGVAKLEQGVREPSWATVQALARALGVSVLAFTDEAQAEELAPASSVRSAPPQPVPAGRRAQSTSRKARTTKRRGRGSP